MNIQVGTYRNTVGMAGRQHPLFFVPLCLLTYGDPLPCFYIMTVTKSNELFTFSSDLL